MSTDGHVEKPKQPSVGYKQMLLNPYLEFAIPHLPAEKPQVCVLLFTSPALCWEPTSPAVPTLGSSLLQKGGS